MAHGTWSRSSGVVNVIKLQLDVNHDGIMDLGFGGPDNTSQARPFVFWINNGYGEPAEGRQPDQTLSPRTGLQSPGRFTRGRE